MYVVIERTQLYVTNSAVLYIAWRGVTVSRPAVLRMLMLSWGLWVCISRF